MKARIHFALAITLALAGFSTVAAQQGGPREEDSFYAHRHHATAEEIFECPAELRAVISDVPQGWGSGPVVLKFNNLVVGKANGKPSISCFYELHATLPGAVPVFFIGRQFPANYGCWPFLKRSAKCRPVLQAPKK